MEAPQQQRQTRLAAAACGSRLDTLALANLHGGLVVDGGRSHALLDLSGHCQECLLDIRCVLGGSLEEGDSEAVGEFLWSRNDKGEKPASNPRSRCPKDRAWVDAYLCHGVLYHLLVLHITLVADEQFVDTLGGVSVNLLEPLLDVVERVHVGHIVHHANTVSATVVGRCDGAESFLAGGVPLGYNSQPESSQNTSFFAGQSIRSEVSRSCHQVRWCGFSATPASASHCGQQPRGADLSNVQNQHRWSRCSFPCRCHRRNGARGKTFQHRSLR